MNTLRTTSIAALATLGCFLTGALPAAATGAEHLSFVEDTDEESILSANENPCGPWDADIHEVRHADYQAVVAPGGQLEGEVHFNGSVEGWMSIDPDGAAGPLPTYTGTYREKENAIVVIEDDTLRNAQFRLREVATAPDGSQLLFVLFAKLTVNARGEVAAEHSLASCTLL